MSGLEILIASIRRDEAGASRRVGEWCDSDCFDRPTPPFRPARLRRPAGSKTIWMRGPQEPNAGADALGSDR